MRSLTLLPSFLLLLSTKIPDVQARRGGGWSGEDSSDSNDGSDSSPESCDTQEHPQVAEWGLLPGHAWNYSSKENPSRDTSYDGSFFKGAGYLHYHVDRSSGSCYIDEDDHAVHLLGYVWIGPQPPTPPGPMNPIIISFKAWESSMSLDEIDVAYLNIPWGSDGPGSSCPSEPDLISLMTSFEWTDMDALKYRALDSMDMSLSEAGTDERRVQFSATMPNELEHNPGMRLRLPMRTCASNMAYQFDNPDRLTMNGSFTNTTLDLTLSGSGAVNGRYEEDPFQAEFNVTFSAVFDSSNSTQKLSLRHPGEPLVAWLPNSALRVARSERAFSLGFVSFGIFILLV
ncbi:uncharacterized protein BJX67DRAFT_236256 [Aspergillus lucknowensis]|uniref:Uncharacterized protein n=1 Tax=Aspergillus lucknowensis TaxID=176173 RepID=A0ABR4LHV3_9EURO